MSGDLPGCTCGPWWGIVLPPPCPFHVSTPPVQFIPIAIAWECIRCKKINAPHIPSCDCHPFGVVVTGTTIKIDDGGGV